MNHISETRTMTPEAAHSIGTPYHNTPPKPVNRAVVSLAGDMALLSIYSPDSPQPLATASLNESQAMKLTQTLLRALSDLAGQRGDDDD
jgi:hypothetical protein